MKEVNDATKRMPYCESEDYLDGLIEKSTRSAIARQRPKGRARRARWIAAAATVVVTLGIGFTYYLKTNRQPQPVVTLHTEDPLDVFLNGLSDEDAQLLDYYEIEDIPEY